MMRHMYIRGILAVVWMGTAIVSGISGNIPMAVLYAALGGVFFYSSYTMWKKDKDGGR